jgi:hypothetical protein
LIFERAINWDEFLHFGHIYELADGRLTSSLQTISTRLFGWATTVSHDIITQIQAVRIVMLASAVVAAASVTLLARRLVGDDVALICGLAYLTAGFVFTNLFTYRPDPVSAAALMVALCLFAHGRLSWIRVAAIGVLIGFAGTLTIKSIFYAPCFGALLWLRWKASGELKSRELVFSGIIVLIAIATFILLINLHSSQFPASEAKAAGLEQRLGSFLRFFEFEKIRYVFAEAILAPLVTIGLLLLPFVVRNESRTVKTFLIGLCGPLLCILFYRNTFPYFFTFLLPPICVAIAPVLSRLIERYGHIPVIIFTLIGPVVLLFQEPFGTLSRQRATIDEVERLFPEPTPYLSYSSYIPHYPRQFPSLISGVGLQRYWDHQKGTIARDVKAGKIAFVISTGDVFDAVLGSREPTRILPEQDVETLRKNYLRHSDTIFILGREICPSSNEQTVNFVRSSIYALEGGGLVIDGQFIDQGKSINLGAGPHKIFHPKGPCVKMWALDHVPVLPKNFPAGPIAGGF